MRGASTVARIGVKALLKLAMSVASSALRARSISYILRPLRVTTASGQRRAEACPIKVRQAELTSIMFLHVIDFQGGPIGLSQGQEGYAPRFPPEAFLVLPQLNPAPPV